MSKSDDNTNELESYGVWVKNSGNSENTENPSDPSDELNLDDVNLDLPDFDDSDFSDMFKDQPLSTDEAALDDFGSEDDTTLSTDELANITDGFEVEQVDAPAESDDLDLGDFDIPDSTEIEEEAAPDFEIEESTESTDDFSIDSDETPASEEISFDTDIPDSTSEELNFDIDDKNTEETASEDSTEEVSFDIGEDQPATEEVSFEDDSASTESDATEEFSIGDDEEISLDDFMDGGFSDESVAAGNNGYEAGAEPAVSSDTEELSLDDFMDGDSFETAPAEAKEAEEIVDEAPLDMDISFDDSADSVETEDNVSLDISDDDDDLDDDTEDSTEVETEEVSLDDFGSSFTAEETSTPSVSASDENINTEDVDLSDFGIDADAEETPIVQDVEEAKNKEKVVDYELSVGDENTASAPVVNEIKSDTVEEIEEAAPVAEKTNSTSVDNSLLQQIVSELSSLKDEMNKLKSNLAEIKTQESSGSGAGAAIAAGAAGLAAGAVIAAATSEADEIPEAKDEGGFFSGDDEDETIALSFDELDNIMNTAEFGDTVEADSASEDDTAAAETEEPVVDDTISEEPVIEETSVDIDESEASEETVEGFVEESPVKSDATITEDFVAENTEIEEIADTSDDTVIEESIISSEVEATEDTEDSVESEIENAISNETDTSLDDITFDEDQPESFDYKDEKLEEPEIDEFIPDGNDELYENEELPDEISIPKTDDLLVESNSSDFMDSVKETTEEEQAGAEFVAEEADEVDTIDLPSELPDSISDAEVDSDVTEESEEITEDNIEDTIVDSVEEPIDDDIPTVDKLLSDEPESVEEPVIEEEEPFVSEETAVDEAADETISGASFAEVDNLDNNLSESNLAYLDKNESDGVSDSLANADLKQDIKSVLLYMDQLLENLPEDKIVEFAKSDEFVTYKKLFNELGLS